MKMLSESLSELSREELIAIIINRQSEIESGKISALQDRLDDAGERMRGEDN